jgi:hypothetical protein
MRPCRPRTFSTPHCRAAPPSRTNRIRADNRQKTPTSRILSCLRRHQTCGLIFFIRKSFFRRYPLLSSLARQLASDLVSRLSNFMNRSQQKMLAKEALENCTYYKEKFFVRNFFLNYRFFRHKMHSVARINPLPISCIYVPMN